MSNAYALHIVHCDRLSSLSFPGNINPPKRQRIFLKSRKLVWLLAGLLASDAQALQVRHSVDQERLTATISNHELNRIAVEGDRIAQVFGTSNVFVIETDEVQGQVFIKPTQETAKTPFTVTVVTESGLTQDLLLTPQSIPSETILIKGASTHKQEAATWETASPFKETLLHMMQAMAQAQPLPGYGIEPCHRPLSLWRDLEMIKVKTYKGDKLEGQIFYLKNRSLSPITLCEKQFLKDPHIAAIAIKRHTLEPGESTQLFMVKHV